MRFDRVFCSCHVDQVLILVLLGNSEGQIIRNWIILCESTECDDFIVLWCFLLEETHQLSVQTWGVLQFQQWL